MRDRAFNAKAHEVRSILEGRKTQTRRVAKGVHAVHAHTGEALARLDSAGHRITCPYGQPGDRLWVREAWCAPTGWIEETSYRATAIKDGWTADEVADQRWRSPIHMPRSASRITLEVTGVRVERLQEISDSDCLAEGIEPVGAPAQLQSGESVQVGKLGSRYSTARALYADLWESINGPGSWDANPLVWVIEFCRIDTGAV